MLDQEQLEELDRLADAATPGPWEWRPRHGTVMGDFKSPRGSICDFGDATQYYPTEGTPPSDEDAAFIAAANPKTTKALIAQIKAQADRIEALEEGLRPFANEAMSWQKFHGKDPSEHFVVSIDRDEESDFDAFGRARFDMGDLRQAAELLQKGGGDG